MNYLDSALEYISTIILKNDVILSYVKSGYSYENAIQRIIYLEKRKQLLKTKN